MLKRRGLKPKTKTEVKKSNIEIIEEQAKLMEKLKMKVDKLTQIVKIKNDKIGDLEERIAEIQAEQ